MKKTLRLFLALMLVVALGVMLAVPAYADTGTGVVDKVINFGWLIFAAAICLFVIVVLVVRFFRQPTSEQAKKIKEWLLYAVIEAEKVFGSGTGKLKLRYVYDWFLTRFPWAVNLVSFELFCKWVDDALEQMRKLLEENESVAAFIYPTNNTVSGVPPESPIAE